jgi:hypothetical protein
MSSVGIEVNDVMEKVAGEVPANVLDSRVNKLDRAEVHPVQGFRHYRAEQPSEYSFSSNAKRKEDTGHECSFCCTCWTDE